MEAPLVSVIVPNYNHQAFLQQRLESIFEQTFQDFEVILLDDASTDASAQLLNSYASHPKVREVVINSKNSGSPFKQWAKGIALARGTYIWIAESDDFAAPTFLETTVATLNSGAGICYTQSYDVNENGDILSSRIAYTSEFVPNIWNDNFSMKGIHFIEKYLAEKNVIPNASAVVFKKELVASSFFSEALLQMKLCGDWFFWLQLSQDTTLSFVASPLNYFRIHQGVSRSYKDLEKKKRRLLEEITCRNFVKSNLGVTNNEKEENLVTAWCRLHSKWAPFQKGFYRFKLGNISTFYVLLTFIKVKLKCK